MDMSSRKFNKGKKVKKNGFSHLESKVIKHFMTKIMQKQKNMNQLQINKMVLNKSEKFTHVELSS